MSEGIPKEVRGAIETDNTRALHAMGRKGGRVSARNSMERIGIREADVQRLYEDAVRDAVRSIQAEISGGQREMMQDDDVQAEAELLAREIVRIALVGVRGESKRGKHKSLIATVPKPD